MNNNFIKSSLIRWYDINKRELPWRYNYSNKNNNSYKVLVSEFMLQQTTVQTVNNRYNEFIRLWPSIKELSIASETKILKFWTGLGYYNRAKNLLRSAKIIKKKYNSKIPSSYSDLIKLPGVGNYTALAIQGIAFNKPVMAIDANVERVIARIYGLYLPVNQIKKEIKKYSEGLIHKKQPGKIIQSLMDFGSLICKPRNPDCEKCFLKKICISYEKNLTNVIPVKKIKIKKKFFRYAFAFIIINEDKILLRKRKPKGMLPSMLEVPTSEWKSKPILRKNIKNYFPISIKYIMLNKELIYSFSHFDLHIKILYGKTKKKIIKNHKWYLLEKINNLELPTIMKKIIGTYINN